MNLAFLVHRSGSVEVLRERSRDGLGHDSALQKEDTLLVVCNCK